MKKDTGRPDVRNTDEDEIEDDIVVLQDEEGKESKFKILFDSLFVGERQYVVLLPVEQEEAMEPEIVILRVDTNEDGESILSTIDDDDEWEEVLKAFEEMDVDENIGDYDIVLDDEDEEEEEEEEPKA